MKKNVRSEKEDRGSIGFILYPERGGYYPTFRLAKALQKIGFRVIYFGTADFEDDINAQGLEFKLLFKEEFGEGTFDGTPLKSNTSRIQYFKHTMSLLRHKNAVLFKALTSGQLVEVFHANKIDLLLVDALLSPIAIAATHSRIPVITVATELVARGCSVTPHYSWTICSEKSPFMSVRIALEWRLFKWKSWVRSRFNQSLMKLLGIPKFDPQVKSLFEDIKQQCNLDYTLSEYGRRVLLPEIVLCPREFDFPMNVNVTNRIYLGHCIDIERKDPPFPWDLLNDGGPIVYCSLGTHVADYRPAHTFFPLLLKTASRLREYTFVISMGPGRKIEDYGSPPPNVIAQTRVPQIAILQRASMMITNGGLGTIKECIYFSVPMLVLPCAFDQPGNSARVCYHKIGCRANIRKISEKSLITGIREIMNNPIYSFNISKMSKFIREDSGFSEGLEFITEKAEKNSWRKKDHASPTPIYETA